MAEQFPLPPASTPNQVLGYVYDGMSQWLRDNGSYQCDPPIARDTETGLGVVAPTDHAPAYRFVLSRSVVQQLSPQIHRRLEPVSLHLAYYEPHFAVRMGAPDPSLIHPRLLITDERSDSRYRDWEIYPNHSTAGDTTWGYTHESSPEFDTEHRRMLDLPSLVGLTGLLALHDVSSLHKLSVQNHGARLMNRIFKRF